MLNIIEKRTFATSIQNNRIMIYYHFAELVHRQAEKYGSRTALKYRDNATEKWLKISWRELSEKIMLTAKAMAEFGIEGPLWLMDTEGFIILPMWVIAFVCLWQYVGQSMMLYMAQISGISTSLYEASYIDGCTKPQSFRYITLPLIKPMVATAMSLNAIGSLKFFDLIFNMTEGGPNHQTEVLATHLYAQGFKYFKYGYASAIGVVLLVICLAVTLFINKCVKCDNYEM